MLNEVIVSGSNEIVEQIIEIPVSDVPDSEISVEISSEPLYCLCQEPWDVDNRKFMIHCDHCSDWFHGLCVGISDEEARNIEKYHCPKCTFSVGPSVFHDIRSRKTGKRVKSVRCTPEFIAKLKDYKFNIPDEVILKMRGQALTLPWLIMKGFTRPILIETTEALGIKVPPDTFTVHDVERYVGSDMMVDVIDVERQTDILMSMREFTEYFTSPNRSKLLNLISLEFTHTNLNKLVDAPSISQKLDWVGNYWPANPNSYDEERIQRPAVSKYCLISAKDSYTDFHIDFGGTSVWYHVLWGEKVFYLIEPSELNLNLYHRWMDGEMGDECFLADEVPVCFRCVLKKGQTLLIPTGWIHAVYTPEDSLVFGGNFLHFLNMDLQLQVYEMEKQMQMPTKYLFPSFEATHWYAAEGLIQNLQTLNTTSFVPAYLIKGVKALVSVLKLWFAEKDVNKFRREYIPSKLNCKKVIQDLCKQLRLSEKRLIFTPTIKESIMKDKELTPLEPIRNKETLRKESTSQENGYAVTSSQESSPSSVSIKEPLKIMISSGEVIKPKISPPLPLVGPHHIKLRFIKQPQLSQPPSDADGNSPTSPRGVKIRLSLSGKSESVDYDSTTGSDALYIVESDYDLTDSGDYPVDDRNSKPRRKHRHKKCKKSKSGKLKHDRDQNKAINDVLAGTLDGMEELFKSSNYSERISQCENTSQAVKDSVAGMDAMKDTILPLKKRGKHGKRKGKRLPGEGEDASAESDNDGIEKVHQDDDYIYLPLAGSDDDLSSSKGKNKHGRRKEDDESWSPRVKVGHVGQRESKSARFNAKREAVEKGLEKAAAILENSKKLKRKHKEENNDFKKEKKRKLVPSVDTQLTASTSSKLLANDMNKNCASPNKLISFTSSSTTAPSHKKPKKGMATPKQRLGKILKINKFARF